MALVNKASDKNVYLCICLPPTLIKRFEGMGYILFISLSIVPRILLGMEEVKRHFILKKR